MNMRILIVEDDPKTASLLSSSLKMEGFEVQCEKDGLAGLKAAQEGGYDVWVLDVMLPKLDGLNLVKTLRSEGYKTPAIMLSARGEVEQRIEGLDAGADDYLPKPYAISELLARLRSLLRRNTQSKPTTLTVADLTFDMACRDVRRGGKRIELSSRESLLLECLMRAEGRVVSRRDIISSVWEYDFDPGTNLVEVYVRRLREKIDRDHPPALIQTVRGLGYALRMQS
ncbi:two-component system OmpR family response regulator/two-component system copper resistance phosphate regulon response regulator CusR [Prosthecobacter fusiformis]|uniref:Two-component system OmpR family response regulator/two-component system copper resistance phosphate regulon response regulator CusR n=1 Tax=Prosthecobacter fusiformis TaxID=48464 RepID=A0A4R7SQP2_9BACT|nr:response regulator transcription factor [Prosthecobacter fusiformis]TDU81234.1 two-component system OmpR family response regulator/two-component system copper resistance phosphate regulon response regulator CusR [Prosthecobacter fusiformis]